ncbi:MAG: acyl-CoA thioesterase [Flavobacteriales bacterium]|nr:acyl-CoA thioesterase [Flavobacteriia bacterium]NCP07017.1 acyl-CoA thioesterase [Flavobacteriales bacterium]PIV93536.1 MAG: thioesterase [Flavobacteriaceae bacterium CG17_big_fil_post_rev_8_21_14_2_50_33_15]PIY09689.1 MAG: thioesterase [Flavobacteriaceae bacterium CG_4_10_14_3_um_filter_33_47]PJB16575.1 MAG: thioesterase [Flavobacteriaceae bacterium CG_4_9_14_3_um_filter_33_16]
MKGLFNCDEIQIRVRYGETDQMGVVHHGNYALYLEMGRIEWLRKLGVSYKKMEESGVMMPVISMSLNFKKSAYYDDVIHVKTQLKNRPTAKIEFEYEITDDKGEIITTAQVVLAFIDVKTKRPVRAPKYILDVIDN